MTTATDRNIELSTHPDAQCIPVAAEIDLQQSGNVVFPADLDGDGVHELLLLQSPGLFHAEIHGGSKNLGWDHYCLTAMTRAGRVLWRIGSPWTDPEPFASHGSERAVAVFDLDGDGQVEVYAIRASEILKIDAQRGAILDVWPLPYDHFRVLCPARIGPRPSDTRLLVSPSDRSYDGHGYANPACFLDANGQAVFSRDIHGAGHDPLAADLDGDGCDEWLIGYEMLDSAGEKRWRFDPTPPEQFDDEEMHVDGLSLHWSENPDDRRIAYAGSQFVFVLDLDGNLVWSKTLEHPQQVIFANLCDDRPGPQLLVVNKRATLQLFDFHGELIWTLDPQAHWPHGKTPGVDQKFHVFDPCLRLQKVTPRGLDAIVYIEGGWPYAVDGSGRHVLEFECPGSAQQPAVTGRRRPDDFGAGYTGRVFMEHGRQKLLVADRRRAWLFEIPSH